MFKKIIMPTDGSDYALRAAEYCGDLAKKYEATVDLLFVAEIPPVLGMQPSEDHTNGLREQLTAKGYDALNRTSDVLAEYEIEPHKELVFGSAVPDILRHARDGGYDLLVMGSRGAGTTAVDQILIGSVAEGILHSAPCPILMVRPG